ncbi:MAG: hypothetical protein AB7S99_04280 [Pseudodonghicola sp.]
MTRCCFLLAALAALPAAPLRAQSPLAEVICDPTGAMYDRLTRRLGATRTATGIRDREQIIEVWTDRQGDWTLVATYATGTSCILAMGEAWQTLTPRDPSDRAPAGQATAGDPEG